MNEKIKKAGAKVVSFAKRIDPDYIFVVLAILAGVFVVCAFTGKWPNQENPYNSYALQAQSWLEGRLDLGMNYPYLELAIYNGKYFVSFPPFVSYILVPFVMLKGGEANTPDNLIAIFVFVLAGIYAVKLYKLLRKGERGSVFFTLFLLIASNALFCGFNGWVWFIAQTFAFTLSLMSIYYARKGALGWSLTFLACAVGCRPFQFVYLPVILLIYITQWKKQYPATEERTAAKTIVQFIKTNWYKCIFPLMVGCSYMWLNFKRFGNPFEFGHNYLPEFTEAENGQFSLSYMLPNIKSLFRLPTLSPDKNILTFPTFDGVAVWIVSPIFITFIIYLIYSIVKMIIDAKKGKTIDSTNRIMIILLPVLFIFHILFIVSHKTMGGWHFGNRYVNDLLPFVFYGLLLFMPKKNDKWKTMNFPLFIFGLGINIVGTIILINGWS